MMSFTAIDVTLKRLKIAKLRLQIPVDNSKSYSKRNYFFKIKEKKTELWCSKVGSTLPIPSIMTSSTEIDVALKWLQIAKFRLQILIDNSKSYPKCTYFFKIVEKMTELWCFKVGSNLPIPIFSSFKNDVFHRNQCQA